jgi:hypothetical protein
MISGVSRSESLLVLAQATTTETTEWWRIIALVAVTLATVAVLALIFRPSVRGIAEPNGPHGEPPRANGERPSPGGFPEPDLPWQPPPADPDLAAERLRQIVSQSAGPAAVQRRPGARRATDKQVSTGPPETSGGAQQGTTGEEDTLESTGIDIGAGAAPPEAGAGGADLEAQINRLFGGPGVPGNVVQFTPRRPPTEREQQASGPGNGGRRQRGGLERVITGFPVDTATRDGVTATIQELLFCSNVGELLHGFALYTDRFLFKFMDESRLSEDEFRKMYSDVPAKDPSEWIRVDSMSRFARLPDGRVSVRVRYIDGSQIDGREELVLKYDARLERWLIDDIRPV